MAVGSCPDALCVSDVAASTHHVLDDDRLVPDRGEFAPHDPSEYVDARPGRAWNDHLNMCRRERKIYVGG